MAMFVNGGKEGKEGKDDNENSNTAQHSTAKYNTADWAPPGGNKRGKKVNTSPHLFSMKKVKQLGFSLPYVERTKVKKGV